MAKKKSGPRQDSQALKQRAFEMHCQFANGRDIARELNVAQSTVSRWLRDADKEVCLSPENLIKAGRFKVQSLFRLEKAIREAYNEWERSKLPAETISTKTTGEGENQKTEVTKTVKGQCGDPRYLDTIVNTIVHELKILGIYAPDGQGGEAEKDRKSLAEIMNEILEVKQVKALTEKAKSQFGESKNGDHRANGHAAGATDDRADEPSGGPSDVGPSGGPQEPPTEPD